MKEAAANWMLFHDFQINIDWGNQIGMLKEGQVMTEFCPDWLYGIHFQGTAEDTEWLADSPMRMTSLPGMTADASRTTSWGGTSGAVPKQAPNPELSIDILLYLYFDNTEGQMGQRFIDIGLSPGKIIEAEYKGQPFAKYFFICDPDGYKIEVLQRGNRFK